MMPENAERLIQQLRPLLADEAAYGRLHADFHDMIEICAQFLQLMKGAQAKPLTRDELEDFLIEVDSGLVEHAAFHLESMKKEIGSALEKLALAQGQGENVAGAAKAMASRD